MREPVTCWVRCFRCRSSWTMMKPTVAKRNMPAAISPRPPFVLPIVATSTIEPRLPSIGMAFISTPLAPSLARSGVAAGARSARSAAPARRGARRAAWSSRARNYPARTWLTPPVAGEGPVVVTDVMSNGTADSLAVSVHGPVGVLDLVVPSGAVAADLAEEYARQAGPRRGPHLVHATRRGARPRPPARPGRRRCRRPAGRDQRGRSRRRPTPDRDATDAERRRVRSVRRSSSPRSQRPARSSPGGAPSTVLLRRRAGRRHRPAARRRRRRRPARRPLRVARGSSPRRRSLPEPTFALAWDPQPERLPMVVGRVRARGRPRRGRRPGARPRAPTRRSRSGSSRAPWSSASPGCARSPARRPRLVWSVLLLAAVLAARFVPSVAIDVPDQYLLDLERLAVTAWSARERTGGKRGRSVVPPSAVSAVATRGTRIITAGAAAVAGRRRRRRAAAARDRDPAGGPDRRPLPGRLRRSRAAPRGPQLPPPRRPRPVAYGGPRLLGRAAGRASCGCSTTRAAGSSRRSPSALGARDRPGGGRDRPGLAFCLVVAAGRGGRGAVRRAGPGRLVVVRPDGSASCGRWRACGNSAREV